MNVSNMNWADIANTFDRQARAYAVQIWMYLFRKYELSWQQILLIGWPEHVLYKYQCIFSEIWVKWIFQMLLLIPELIQIWIEIKKNQKICDELTLQILLKGRPELVLYKYEFIFSENMSWVDSKYFWPELALYKYECILSENMNGVDIANTFDRQARARAVQIWTFLFRKYELSWRGKYFWSRQSSYKYYLKMKIWVE